MSWNLHIVGHAVENDLERIVNNFSKNLSAAGHVVESIVLTTDAGSTKINPVVADAADVVKAVDPATIPVVDAVTDAATDVAKGGGIFDTLEEDAQKLIDDIKTKTTKTAKSTNPTTGGVSSDATTKSTASN